MLSPAWFFGSAILAIVMTLILFSLIVSPITKCTTLRVFIFSAASSIGWSICLCILAISSQEKMSMQEIVVGAIEVFGLFFLITLISLLSWRAWAKWVSPHLK